MEEERFSDSTHVHEAATNRQPALRDLRANRALNRLPGFHLTRPDCYACLATFLSLNPRDILPHLTSPPSTLESCHSFVSAPPTQHSSALIHSFIHSIFSTDRRGQIPIIRSFSSRPPLKIIAPLIHSFTHSFVRSHSFARSGPSADAVDAILSVPINSQLRPSSSRIPTALPVCKFFYDRGTLTYKNFTRKRGRFCFSLLRDSHWPNFKLSCFLTFFLH